MHEQILPHIRQDIIEGRWRPGERLPEPTLCREFNVSRTPLRDALRLLESEGLLKLVPHVGAVVTEAISSDICEKMELLIAIEQFAAFTLATRGSKEIIDEIAHLHRKMGLAAKASDPKNYFAINDKFHRAIVLGVENSSLADAHQRVMWHVHRARHLANTNEPLTRDAARHHQHIVDAIVARDGEAAQLAMRSHLSQVMQAVSGRNQGGQKSIISLRIRQPT